MVGNPAVFLDRDGVLNFSEVRNGKPYAPRFFSDFKIFPEVPAALQKLKSQGYLLIVVTNQPDIGNGLVDIDEIRAMHELLWRELPLTDIRVCPHTRSDECSCRKPKPGLLLQAASTHNIDMAKSIMFGDRYGDMQAGYAAGCRACVFIDRDYTEPCPNGLQVDHACSHISAAVDWVLASHERA